MATAAPTAADQTSADAVQARIEVSLAQARSLVSSWMGPAAPEDSHNPHVVSPLGGDLFDSVMHTPRLGLGATAPATNDGTRKDPASELRRRIMGKNSAAPKKAMHRPDPRHESTEEASESEEEAGRSALGGSARKKSDSKSSMPKVKRFGASLDSHLARKQKKKRKRMKIQSDHVA